MGRSSGGGSSETKTSNEDFQLHIDRTVGVTRDKIQDPGDVLIVGMPFLQTSQIPAGAGQVVGPQMAQSCVEKTAVQNQTKALLIGVAFGLLVTNTPFTFMALLGFIALVGMMLKNGIVLVDQINLEINEGKELYNAIFDSAVSRVRPVSMAMITTVLGMIPLLFDAFFKSMAVTIMFGLGFATVFTLLIVPVMYSILYRVKYKPLEA